VLLAGTEPNLRWRTFSEAVAEVAEQLGVEMVITLGALLADVTHTMPVPITGLASDEQMVEELGLQRSNYEGPTGIVGVLHDACNKKGISSASLWAAVPHYVAAIPNPKAALALLRRLEGMVGVAIEASGLEDETDSFENQVSSAVDQNPEIAEMVERLQAEHAEAMEGEEEELELPSADSLARDFERYLRQQGPDPGPPGPPQN
jgi:predicted ATP-grasp superfamily ATP-dependent carboligase